MCIANESSVEELALLKGQIELTSAHGCQCIDPQSRCHKQRNIQVYHWGTKYEKTVDVGRCVGSCHQKGRVNGTATLNIKYRGFHGNGMKDD